MTRGATSSLLLGFLLGCSATSALPLVVERPASHGKCSLAGTWVNELGSKMIISPTNAKGEFTGSYLTGVSASQNTIQASTLQGVQHHTDHHAQPTFGFTVSWTFSDSTTVFVGQCFLDVSGRESLETMWLLREEVTSAEEDWKATRVGRNTFIRVK